MGGSGGGIERGGALRGGELIGALVETDAGGGMLGAETRGATGAGAAAAA